MKLSSSSSSSSSIVTTTTSTSVDVNIQTPKSSAIGCISGMVRRLLCRNSLPTYPYDQLKLQTQLGSVEAFKLECSRKENEVEASSVAAPGLVARLMGLESLPPGMVGGGHEKSSPNSISRSRSMNSVDALTEIASIQGKCRRAKSFREIPTFVEEEEYLILSFEKEEKRMKTKQSKVGKSKRRKSVSDENKENREPGSHALNENLPEKIMKDSNNISHCDEKSSRNLTAGNEMGELVKSSEFQKDNKIIMKVNRGMGKMKDNDFLPAKKIEAECDSEYSSPNSVLDDTVFPCDSQITYSGEHSRLKNSKTRRTLTEELQNYRKLILIDAKSFKKPATQDIDEIVKFKNNYRKNHMHVKIWENIRKIAEKEVIESVWMQKGIQKLEDWRKEFTGDMEMEILDELLDVLVDQLCR